MLFRPPYSLVTRSARPEDAVTSGADHRGYNQKNYAQEDLALQQLHDSDDRYDYCDYPEDRTGHLLSPLFECLEGYPCSIQPKLLTARFRSTGSG